MSRDSTRRTFLAGATMAATGLGASDVARSDLEPTAATEHEHAHRHSSTDSPRDRPVPVGPLGPATERVMLVPGLRPQGMLPVLVTVPDLPEKLPWKLVDGAKEFHLYCRHTRREFLPDQYFDVWGFNGS